MQIWRKWRFIQIKETEAATEKRFGLKKGQHVKRKRQLRRQGKKERQEEKKTKREALNWNKKGGAELKQREEGWNRKKEENRSKRERAETERQRLNWEDWDEVYFQHLFSFESPQKNDGEFVYVEFNF